MDLETYLKQNYRPSVASDYGHRIRGYREAVPSAATALYADVLAYVDALRQNRGLHGKTLRNHLSAIKAYYRWLQFTGERVDHPCAGLILQDRVDRRVHLDELYGAERLAAWLAASAPGIQRVAASLLVDQALMSAEAVRIGVADVDLVAGTVYVRGGGKTDARTLALKASQVLMIDGYLKGDRRELSRAAPRGRRSDLLLLNTQGGPVAAAALNKLVNLGREEGARLRPLKVRQSVIAGLLDAGHDVRIVQALAGHRTATATEQYRMTGLKELQQAVRELHPRQ